MESGVLHVSDVLCRKVLIPAHDAGGLTWGIFAYVVATAGTILILVGDSEGLTQ